MRVASPWWVSLFDAGVALFRFHFTEFQCGALPCNKFPSNREVPCVVCSRERTGGTTYVRWGNSSCPQTAQIVYSGHAAGAQSSEQGGGANPLCLHSNPSYGLQYSDSDQDGARLYGVKYSTSGYGLSGSFYSASSYTIPCAVCFTPLVYSTIEVAGRSDCPRDWKLEYSGYLFAAHYSHYKSNWVCVDREPERLSYHSGSGGWWYPTEIECGSISCDVVEGRYGQNKEVTCAVCSTDTERYGVVYTRWGRSDCPSGSRVAYTGQAVGSHYNSETGSGANVLCLHSVALFGLFDPSNHDGARMYGYEYEPWGLQDQALRSVGNHEVLRTQSGVRRLYVVLKASVVCRCRVLSVRTSMFEAHLLCLAVTIVQLVIKWSMLDMCFRIIMGVQASTRENLCALMTHLSRMDREVAQEITKH